MADPNQQLSIRIFEDFNTTALMDDLSQRWTSLNFSTQLHGGFGACELSAPMDLPQAWLYLNREGARGRHFYHLEITDAVGTVWEGRIMDITLRRNNAFQGIELSALGYYSSLKDRLYDTNDAGMTDWTAGGPHSTGKVIREMITQRCTAVNGTVDITLGPEDIVGIDLSARTYPMDVIVEKLAPLAGTGADTWYFAIWEGRKPSWAARSVSTVDWLISLSEISDLQLTQQGLHLRNYILPVVGTAEGTGIAGSEAGTLYPRRELMLQLSAGVPTTAANNARDITLTERRNPSQDQTFTIKGHVYSTQAGTLKQTVGAVLEEKPKWWLRAGQVVRIHDLVPASVATGTMDSLRTFYALETRYNAVTDSLEIQPDRSASDIGVFISRLGQIELDR